METTVKAYFADGGLSFVATGSIGSALEGLCELADSDEMVRFAFGYEFTARMIKRSESMECNDTELAVVKSWGSREVHGPRCFCSYCGGEEESATVVAIKRVA